MKTMAIPLGIYREENKLQKIIIIRRLVEIS
jgi:hypothetical protein